MKRFGEDRRNKITQQANSIIQQASASRKGGHDMVSIRASELVLLGQDILWLLEQEKVKS